MSKAVPIDFSTRSIAPVSKPRAASVSGLIAGALAS